MAKHHIFLHIGPDAVELGEEERTRLAAAGVRTTDVSDRQLANADLEIRRLHKSAVLKRRDVEGTWAEISRTVYAARSDAFLSLPGFWLALADQVDLALDGMHGLKVHLVMTGELADLPDAWLDRVKPGRTHVLPQGSSPANVVAEVSRIALTEEKQRLEKSLLKLKRRRKQKSRGEIAA